MEQLRPVADPPLSGTRPYVRSVGAAAPLSHCATAPLSVSNPKNKYVAYVSVLSRISNCQGLGRKNKFEILKTDRTRHDCPLHDCALVHDQTRGRAKRPKTKSKSKGTRPYVNSH